MDKKPIGLVVLIVATLMTGGCWPWQGPTPPATPMPTATPPKVEEAGQRSPPIEGRLLYARGDNIWMRTGMTAHRLTDGMPATQPCWSPDGNQIVFVVKEEAFSDLYVMEADGRDPHPITENESSQPKHSNAYVHSSYWAFQPQWIPPDGEWIGYLSHAYPGGYTTMMSIWRIRPDGSEDNLHRSLDGHIESPVWSPDGNVLAFVFYTYADGAQLRYADPDSGVILALGESAEGVERYDPAWSPDGQWIAYAARKNGQTDLWVMPSPLNPSYSAGWSPARLTDQGMARMPAWSPDGQQIAFIAKTGDSFDLWLLDLENKPGQSPQPADSPQQLTFDAQVDATARPSWTD